MKKFFLLIPLLFLGCGTPTATSQVKLATRLATTTMLAILEPSTNNCDRLNQIVDLVSLGLDGGEVDLIALEVQVLELIGDEFDVQERVIVALLISDILAIVDVNITLPESEEDPTVEDQTVANIRAALQGIIDSCTVYNAALGIS